MIENKKEKPLSEYLSSGLKTLGTGIRFGSEIASGLEAREVGRFNVKQASRELKELGVSRVLSAKQMERYAAEFKGAQQTVAATSGLAISGSIVDMMADTAAQLKLQQSVKDREFEAQRTAISQERALTKRQTRASEFGSYFRAGALLGKSFAD